MHTAFFIVYWKAQIITQLAKQNIGHENATDKQQFITFFAKNLQILKSVDRTTKRREVF